MHVIMKYEYMLQYLNVYIYKKQGSICDVLYLFDDMTIRENTNVLDNVLSSYSNDHELAENIIGKLLLLVEKKSMEEILFLEFLNLPIILNLKEKGECILPPSEES